MRVKWGAVYGAALAVMGLCGALTAVNSIAESRFGAGFLPENALRAVGAAALVGALVWLFSFIKMNHDKKGA